MRWFRGAADDKGGLAVPMVHPCASPGCEMLTMGDLCVDHERQRAEHIRARLPRLVGATAVVLAAAVGAVLRTRLLR